MTDSNKAERPKNQNDEQPKGMPRRTVLKALAGLPVLGMFSYELLKKSGYDLDKRNAVIKELGLESVEFPVSDYGTSRSGGNLIRVGIIGFGTRATQLAKALGFMHPEEVKKMTGRNTIGSWLDQEYLNVAITGICDVFDLHAANGLATAENGIRPGGKDAPKLAVKRYLTYQEMLADTDIDAVIIATPDHHHARISIDAAKAGKHIYCEKSVAHTEAELNELYDTIKNSDIVYQLGHQITHDTGMIGQLFTHEFDAVNQLLRMGIPASVVSSGGIYYWKDNREMPDSLHCVFEYPDHDFTLTYSGNLASGRSRGRVFMGHDASMELGNTIRINADRDSTRYKKGIASGLTDPGSPMISFNPGAGQVDAVSSASTKYYAARGLTTTTINGRPVDVTHLHLREWLSCIRNGGTPSVNIDRAYEEGIACIMAHQSYVEKRRVERDNVKRKIV